MFILEVVILIFIVFGLWNNFFLAIEDKEPLRVKISVFLLAVLLTRATIYFMCIGGKMYE